MARVTIDVGKLYEDTAKLDRLDEYEGKALSLAGEGNDVVLTGRGPVWLYLRLAHALHGTARSLTYTSPASGDVVIFDHNPF